MVKKNINTSQQWCTDLTFTVILQYSQHLDYAWSWQYSQVIEIQTNTPKNDNKNAKTVYAHIPAAIRGRLTLTLTLIEQTIKTNMNN